MRRGAEVGQDDAIILFRSVLIRHGISKINDRGVNSICVLILSVESDLDIPHLWQKEMYEQD